MTIASDRKKKLKRLARTMGLQSARLVPPMPPILEMLDMSLGPIELDYLLQMGTRLYTYPEAAALAMMSERQFSEFFGGLLTKGFVETEYDDSGRRFYRLSAVAVGWYETQMHYRMGRAGEADFSRKLHENYSYLRRLNFFPLRPLQNAVLRSVLKPNQSIAVPGGERIQIDRPLEVPPQEVYPVRTASDIIREHGQKDQIGLFRCVCRHGCRLLHDPCRFDMPEESCIVLGDYGRFWLETGYGRRISASEALDVIAEVHEKGAVHTVMHERDDTGRPEIAICNCCWDCCGVFRAYNLGTSGFKFKCHEIARIVPGTECAGCGRCAKYCPTAAIVIDGKRSRLRADLCVGCGQCAHKCANGCLELVPDARIVFLPLRPKSEARLRPV